MWQIRESEGRSKSRKIKRKFLTYKTKSRSAAKKKPTTSASRRRSPASPGSSGGADGVQGAVTAAALLQNNQQLAAVLNSAKVQNAALSAKINDLNGEILDLRKQNARLKQEVKVIKHQQSNEVNPQLEYQVQQKLMAYGAYIEPLMKNLSDALDHTVGLSNTLSLSMKLATGLNRQQKLFTENQTSISASSPIKIKNTRMAQIKPMVKGHSISKPSVRMARLDLNGLQPLNVSIASPTQQQPEQPVEDEAIVIEGSNETEVVESPPLISRQRQKRLRLQNVEARQLRNVNDISDVLEEDSDDQNREEESQGVEQSAENTVLLIPRLVLERVTIESPRKKSPKKDEDDDNLMRRRRKRRLDAKHSNSPKRLTDPYQDWDLTGAAEEMEDNSFIRDSSLFKSPEDDRGETPLRRSSRNARNISQADTPCRIFDDSKDSPEMMVTPSIRRESTEDFMQRVMSMDPLEGPSWLFDDKGNRRKNPPKLKKSRGSLKTAAPKTEETKPSDEPLTPAIHPLAEGDRRSSRRAAARAVGSLKEPSTNKKLRQGDPISSSIYPDYIPETKGRKRVSDKGESLSKRKKLSNE